MIFSSLPASRRQFLQTVAFSAAASFASRFSLRAASQVDPKAEHLFVFGDWGAAGNFNPQRQVAQAMSAYAAGQNITPSALMLLGDNFYGHLDGGAQSSRWQTQFEQ